jgi:pyrroline-5-carboxylate reductase
MNQFKGSIAILGSGNIGISLAKGLVKASYAEPGQISLTRRNIANLSTLADQGFITSSDNAAVASGADLIVLAVLPQQLNQLLDQIRPVVDPKKQVFISVASGVSCADIRSKLGEQVQVIRAMPNTAIAIGQSMTCIATDNASKENVDEVIPDV